MSNVIECEACKDIHESNDENTGYIDKIFEQKAEIERLRRNLRLANESCGEWAEDNAEYEAENAKLQAVVDAALKQDNPCDELIEAIAALEGDHE